VKIPIRISPLFWLSAALIGWINSSSIVGIIVWIGIVFVSIIVHEFGHAIAALLFGQRPRIELVAFGGLTYPIGPKLSPGKEFIVFLCGPLFGFALFLLATLLLPSFENSSFYPALKGLQIVNLIWTILNLFPVIPLDGGQLVRVILEAWFQVRGIKFALLFSLLFAIASGLFFITIGWILPSVFFFLFAFQNFMAYRQLGPASKADGNEALQTLFEQAEEALERGDENSAITLFENIKAQTKEGIIYLSATQILARLVYRKGEKEKAFALLRSIQKELTSDGLILLHLIAFELGEYDLVLSLSSDAFQIEPSADTALRNAIASASHGQIDPAIGWLKAAVRSGLINPLEIIEREKSFAPLISNPAFHTFLKSL